MLLSLLILEVQKLDKWECTVCGYILHIRPRTRRPGPRHKTRNALRKITRWLALPSLWRT